MALDIDTALPLLKYLLKSKQWKENYIWVLRDYVRWYDELHRNKTEISDATEACHILLFINIKSLFNLINVMVFISVKSNKSKVLNIRKILSFAGFIEFEYI